MSEISFRDYISSAYPLKNSGTAYSYLKAISILDEIFKQRDVFNLENKPLTEIKDPLLIAEIINYIVEEEDKFRAGEASCFDLGLPTERSYPRNRFCTAAIRRLGEYVNKICGEDAAKYMRESQLAGAKLSEKLQKQYNINEKGTEREVRAKRRIGQELGFSIKSFIGANSTLFNAGTGTNFIYQILPPAGVTFDCDKFNSETYCTNGKIANRLNKLINEFNCKIVFCGVQSKCLDQNLKTIDYSLPQLLAQMLLIRFTSDCTDIRRCTEILTEQNPLDFDTTSHGPVYEYKVKRFLQDCAMGMTPETPWLGLYDATGGQIIVKEDGETVCYHIHELNRFMDYLYKSTKFESPSTSEDSNRPGHPRENAAKNLSYGWLYEENGEYRIKLNLQVRFK